MPLLPPGPERDRTLDIDPGEALKALEDQIARARVALNDEHEGNFRHACHMLSAIARDLENLVDTW